MKALVMILALVLASCATPATEPPTTSTTNPSTPTTVATTTTTTTTTTVPTLEPTVLSYAYEPRTRLDYELIVDQRVTFLAEGDEAAFPDQDLPVEADIVTRADTTMSFIVSPASEEGTYEMRITAEFGEMSMSGTLNGERIDPDEEEFGSGLAELEAIDVTVVVDAQGNVLSVSGLPYEDEFLGDLGTLSDFGDAQLGRPLGPSFPDRELSVGDTWTEERVEEGPDGPIRLTATHEVVGVETLDGVAVLVIDSRAETEAFDIDLADFMRAMVLGLAALGEEATGEGDADTDTPVPPEVQEMLDQIEFSIAFQPTTSSATTWFDPEAGAVRRATQNVVVSMDMRFVAPDDTTGELMGFTMSMSIDQDARFSLIDRTST